MDGSDRGEVIHPQHQIDEHDAEIEYHASPGDIGSGQPAPLSLPGLEPAGLDVVDCAKLTAPNIRLQQGHIGSEAVVHANHELAIALRNGFGNQLCLGDRTGKRLFDEDVFPVLERGTGNFGMGIRRRANVDDVNTLDGPEILQTRESVRDAEAFGYEASLRADAIADGDNFHPCHSRQQRQVDRLCNIANPDDGHAKAFHGFPETVQKQNSQTLSIWHSRARRRLFVILRGLTALAKAMLYVWIAVVISTGVLSAQPSLRQWTSLGVWGAAGANFHVPQLQLPSGTYDRSATGFGWGAGGSATFPLGSGVGLGIRAGYAALGATLRSTTDVQLQSAVHVVELFPHALLWLGRSHFYVPFGMEVGFSGGSSVREAGQNAWQDVPQQAVRLAIGGGLGWAIPLGQSTTLAPELGVRVPLTDVSSAAQWKPWKITHARLALGLHFGLVSRTREPEPEPKAPALAVSPEVSRLQLEEVRLTEYVPLLPYVFFAEQASTPIAEYSSVASKGEFALERLPIEALQVNRSVLDIVGKRLAEYPTARLTLTGTTDGRREGGNLQLARQRAEWVRQYLVTTWGIAPERLVVQAQRYPSKPSASRSTVAEDRRDGDAENRRVELSATLPDVLAPVPLTADNQRIARPEVLSWAVRVDAEVPIVSWELSLSQAGEVVEVLRGQGQPEASLRWRVAAAKLRAGELPLEYVVRITDARGRTAQAVGSIPVDYISSFRKQSEKLPDRTVTRFSLVLFDFDSDALTPENQRVLEQLVLPFVQANSTVRITGYTDRIGEREYNNDLSLRRARRVRDFLAARVPAARYEVAGYGESVLLFDNESPIGRQLCRTVQITIETPTGSP